jgi:hypothetical protein
MKVHDSLNNQFKLCSYIAKLNINLLQYLENNNININYYCFFSKIIDNIHYIVTSQTTKRRLNGYRLITIQDAEKDNNIFEFNDGLDIIYENINIKITSIIDDVSQISNKLGIIILNFTGQQVNDETFDCFKYYDKNILESKIIKITHVNDMIILNNFKNLKELAFDFYYNRTIDVNVLPNSLQTLTFGWEYNQTIGVNVLPNLLHTLTFGWEYNQTIGVNVLPNSLQTLTFGWEYNQTIGVNVLPNSLKTLTFGVYYDQTIAVNVLPNSLKTLTFRGFYDKIIGINVLPNSLKIIYFNYYNCNKYYNEYIVPHAFKDIVKYIHVKN